MSADVATHAKRQLRLPFSLRPPRVAAILHANNLRDSGFDVVVGLKPDGASAPKARAAGFTVLSVSTEPRTYGLMSRFFPRAGTSMPVTVAATDIFDIAGRPHAARTGASVETSFL